MQTRRPSLHNFLLPFFLALVTLSLQAADQKKSILATHTIHSPNQKVSVRLELKEKGPCWSVVFQNHPIISDSRLGLVPKNSPYSDFKETQFTVNSFNKTWKPTWGKTSSIRNHYTQAVWSIKETSSTQRPLKITLRVYDNAVAVRYDIPGQGKQTFTGDLTEFNFLADHTCWSANGEHPNHGPVALSQWKGTQMPLTIQVAPDIYAALLEAHIEHFAPIHLKRHSGTGLKSVMSRSQVILPAQSSWRTILLGRSPGDLLVNHTMMNLNPPSSIKNTDWIKPGIAMWDWRAWGAKTQDGFTYGLDMESWKRQIDFASKHHLAYLLLDAAWYGLEFDPKEDPTTSRDHLIIQPDQNKPHLIRKPAPKDWKNPIDVPALIKYGKEKNVGVILYLNDAAQKNHDIQKTLATYHQWGAAGIKYGFMRANPQDKIIKTRKIVALCAKYQLLCNFHDGPIVPSGERRTFPNYITREFCHAQFDGLRTFSPTTFCTTVFTNMLAGPLDMDNGFYAINGAKAKRPKIFSELYSTVTAETARIMITFSGLAVLPDIPEAYEAKADLFEFISKLPMNWDETRILNGKIGHFITTARRHNEDWFIASCCHEKGATLPIHLNFLKPNTTYSATLYEDAPDTHFKTNREAYQVRKITVKKGDSISAKLAPGGGHCVIITPLKK